MSRKKVPFSYGDPAGPIIVANQSLKSSFFSDALKWYMVKHID